MFGESEFSSASGILAHKHIAAYAAVVVLGASLGGYAIHEHHTAQNLAAKNQQATAELNDTRHELTDLTTKVNMLVARNDAPTPAAAASPRIAKTGRPPAGHLRRDDPRYKKLQSQLDAQGKAIEDTRNALAGTQGDLVNTRTELTGSIAHTHDELVLLQKKGERNYTEFDISKSKEFQHKGPFGIRLRKANVKHQFADLELIVDDRNLSQKHVNLYQPVMFYTPDSPQPVEVVINDISKDHIHGYISASKYRQSELATMATTTATASQNSGAGNPGAGNPDAGTVNDNQQPAQRQRLPLPQ
jgi:hypothetical protein